MLEGFGEVVNSCTQLSHSHDTFPASAMFDSMADDCAVIVIHYLPFLPAITPGTSAVLPFMKMSLRRPFYLPSPRAKLFVAKTKLG